MNYNQIKEAICENIIPYKTEMVELNDDLADHPEVSGEEYKASRKIVRLLQDKGYVVCYPYAGLPTAFHAVYGPDHHRHKVAIMVEYDALPEIGHACGHCLSCSISLLAAFALKDLQDILDTDIHLVGTPVEETDGAKCAMVEQGIFDNYAMAVMVHLYNENLLTPKLQAMASYEYIFHGKAAHASSAPWDGINALNGVQLFFHAIDMMRQHTRPDAQFHGVIRDGGKVPNVVPERASTEVFIRALDRTYLRQLIQMVDRCAGGAAMATGTTWEKRSTAPIYDNLKPNPSGTEALAEIYQELKIPLNGDPDKIFGSSDAGNVSFSCPTFHPCLQVVDPEIAIHTRKFAESMKTPRAHHSLETGAKIIAFLVAKIFSDKKRIQQLADDFRAEG